MAAHDSSVAPAPLEERTGSVWEIAKELTLGMLPHAILIIATLGTIIWGWATPTEAAAMGVVGAAFLALVYGQFTWQRLKDAVYNTLLQTSTVVFLAVAFLSPPVAMSAYYELKGWRRAGAWGTSTGAWASSWCSS